MMLVSLPTSNTAVMPRLGLGIHEFSAAELSICRKELVDPKAKPWDGEREGGGMR
jgi:hypothetical protein